jgi:hypothetical protein
MRSTLPNAHPLPFGKFAKIQPGLMAVVVAGFTRGFPEA